MWPCCEKDFYFNTLIVDVNPNLLDNETALGCATKFHRPYQKYHKHDYDVIIPKKYMAVKDDIPGFYLNTVLNPGSENPKTLPTGFEYEVPLSLNAETCFSEFRNIEKPAVLKKKEEAKEEVKNPGVRVMLNEDEDLSDLLYNAYSEAQKSRGVVKKQIVRRLKS